MGKASRRKHERRLERERGPVRSWHGQEQCLLEEGPGLCGGLSNGRPYALVERPDLLDHRDPPQPTWRRVWLHGVTR